MLTRICYMEYGCIYR